MAADDVMTIDERLTYLRRMQPRYVKADREGRGQLLGEIQAVTGLHRKSVVRLLGGSLARQRQRTRRRRVYGAAVDDVIRVVWESLDYVCAERLLPALAPTAQHLVRCGEVMLPAEVEEQLGMISRSTVQRILTRIGQDTPRLPRRGPEEANRVRQAVPMERIKWDVPDPGHFETELVHHSGSSSAGTYVHTLQLVDVATGWSERVAVLGRNQEAMEGGFQRVIERLPFRITHLHPDNGSEFFNDHLIRFWGEAITGLSVSRSRPYHKNDNRFVEQKNDTLVRAYLGTERLDTAAQCDTLNALYDHMWTYYNLFQPVLHLVSKDIVDGKLRRRWDTAATPYERLLRTGVLDQATTERLARLHAETNHRQLRRSIYQAIPRVWDRPADARRVA